MLKTEHLVKIFYPGTVNEKRAIDDLSLEVKEGDFISVIGGNGAGKSTLLNLISGVYRADAGTIMLDGKDITALAEHKRASYMGRVFQDPMQGTAASMEIQENLAIAYHRGQPKTLRWAVNKKEVGFYRDQLKRLGLGLEDRMTAKVGLLSGGQRQALTLLMATIQKPRLLLLDEHTAALDPKTAQQVMTLTEEIATDEQLTTVMITHNMNHAIRYGNRLVMMHEGRIIYDISGEEKKHLTVEDLLKKFEQASGGEFSNDRMLLV